MPGRRKALSDQDSPGSGHGPRRPAPLKFRMPAIIKAENRSPETRNPRGPGDIEERRTSRPVGHPMGVAGSRRGCGSRGSFGPNPLPGDRSDLCFLNDFTKAGPKRALPYCRRGRSCVSLSPCHAAGEPQAGREVLAGRPGGRLGAGHRFCDPPRSVPGTSTRSDRAGRRPTLRPAERMSDPNRAQRGGDVPAVDRGEEG
jgi:hypothetical protein